MRISNEVKNKLKLFNDSFNVHQIINIYGILSSY